MATIKVTVSRELVEWFKEHFKKEVQLYGLKSGQVVNRAMMEAKASITGEEQEYEI